MKKLIVDKPIASGGKSATPTVEMPACVLPEELIALKQTNADLQGQVKRLGLYINQLAHDLKTPLTPLVGASELLASGIVAKPWADLAQSIKISAENLHRMVDELLDLEKCECGALELDFSGVDLAKLVNELAGNYRAVASASCLELIVEVPGHLPQVWADMARLRQIVITLLTNAIRYTPGGGRVVLKVAAEGERLHVSVTDSGINILEEDLTDVFELCSRPCQKKTRVGGMSLALARRLVELHSGRIGVESGEGKDNLFWFDIPLTGPRRVGLGAME